MNGSDRIRSLLRRLRPGHAMDLIDERTISCGPGRCSLAARAELAIEMDRDTRSAVAEQLAARLVPHLRRTIPAGLHCYASLAGPRQPAFDLLRAEAGSQIPRWTPECVNALLSGMRCCAAASQAAAFLLAGEVAGRILPLLREAQEAWTETHGGVAHAPDVWGEVERVLAEPSRSPAERVRTVSAALGGPTGQLVDYLAGLDMPKTRARIGIPLAEQHGRSGEQAVLELQVRRGTGLIHPGPQMVLVPCDRSFRRAFETGAVAAGTPADIDISWSVRSLARVLTGESNGAAASVACLAVARRIRLNLPQEGVAGGITPDGVLRSLADEPASAYHAKLAASRRIVVPAADKDLLSPKNLTRRGVRYATTAEDALRLVMRRRRITRWGAISASAVFAVSVVVPAATTGASRAPTVPITTTTALRHPPGRIVGVVGVGGTWTRAASISGDTIAVTDGSQLRLSDLQGHRERTLKLPGFTTGAMGFDGHAYWVASGGYLVRYVTQDQPPSEQLRQVSKVSLPSGMAPKDLAFDGTGMAWIAAGSELIRLDADGRESGRIRRSGTVSGVAFDRGTLWIAEAPTAGKLDLRQIAYDGSTIRTVPSPLSRIESLDFVRGELVAGVGFLTTSGGWLLFRITV